MSRITQNFMVPSYYKNFRCKGGACRRTCCAGLVVNVTREEYFRLVGQTCSAELRADLDVSLDVRRDADAGPDRYARLSPDFFGRCRMLDKADGCKGLCRLQEECGIEALPATCLYFPRSPRKSGGRWQCAMGNACEETLELLYEQSEWKTEELELTFDLPELEDGDPGQDQSEAAGGSVAANEPGSGRQTKAKGQLEAGERDSGRKERVAGEPATAQGQSAQLPAADEPTAQINTAVTRKQGAPQDVQALFALVPARWTRLQGLVHWAGNSYESVRPYCETAQLRFAAGFGPAEYERAIEALRHHEPRFDRFLQLTMTNDLFYHGGSAIAEYTASMLLLLCATNLNESSTREDLIDLFTAFFRMVDLTPFEHNCQVLTAQNVSGGQVP